MLSTRVSLHNRRSQQTRFDVVHSHAIHSRTLHPLESALYSLESRLIGSSTSLEVLHSLLDVVQSLFDAQETLRHVVVQTVELVGERPDGGCEGRVLLTGRSGGNARLMVVSALLDGEAPLISKLDFANGFRAKRAINLARRRVSLLGGAVVLYATTVANEIVTSGLSIAVVGGAQFHNAVTLIFGNALDGCHQVFEGPKDTFWWG